MSHPEPAIFRFTPIFRLAVSIGIRRDDLTFEHHCINVEVKILTNSEKPDVLRTIFPVRLSTTPFLAFPGYPVLRNEIFFTDALNRCRTAPVATDVNRGRGLE